MGVANRLGRSLWKLRDTWGVIGSNEYVVEYAVGEYGDCLAGCMAGKPDKQSAAHVTNEPMG